LLFGFSYLYGLTGSTNLSMIVVTLAQSGPSPLLYVAWVLIVAGLGFKVAAVPFHLWAPDTYEGAPAPAAAFIASVSKVASFALLITISTVALHFVEGLHFTGGYVTFTSYPAGAPRPHVTLGIPSAWPLILVVLSAASM